MSDAVTLNADESESVQESVRELTAPSRPTGRRRAAVPERRRDAAAVDRASVISLVRAGFAAVEPYGTDVSAYVYEHFFTANPRYRKYFEDPSGKLHDRFFTALKELVEETDRLDSFLPRLRQLALTHRKFGIRAPHYQAFGESIIAAIAHFAPDTWNAEAASAWRAWYGMVASVILDEAAAADETGPRYWDAEVIALDLLSSEVARLVVRATTTTGFTDLPPYGYAAGQYAAVELCVLPRVWRDLSFATPRDPSDPGLLEFHVRRTASGRFSAAVHDELSVGDRVRVTPAAGSLALPARDDADEILAVAHGTGIAPIHALLADAVAHGDTRPVDVLVGAETADGHYLADRLAELAVAHGAMTVTHTVDRTRSRAWQGEVGTLPNVLADRIKSRAENDGSDPARWGGVLVGPGDIVEVCHALLVDAGADPRLLSTDLFS
jgi:NAD(P)H-flavin reductase/hemoglobin-like flavoprotein